MVALESNSGQAVQLVYIDENRKVKTDPEAIAALQKLKGPVAVVSLFGRALHGKSLIWNQFLNKSIGFEVQTLHRPCIGDIWMWIEPIKRISEDGTEYTLVLLDVEGADSDGLLDNTLNKLIFSLAILLSSVFIYGPALGVSDLPLDDLSCLLEISKHDHVGQAMENTYSGLGKFSPMFIQFMKEISSENMESSSKLTPSDHQELKLKSRARCREDIEKLRPKCLYGINSLVKFVSEKVRPKQRGDTVITGPPLAGFTKSFSENVNKSVVPKVSYIWQSVEELAGRKAYDTASEVYMLTLERAETSEESMQIEAHNKAVFKALTAFCGSSIGNKEVRQKYESDLWSFFGKAFEDHKRVANMEAYSRCCNAIEDMGKKLCALSSSRDGDVDDMIKALDVAVSEYEVSINGPMKWQKLSSFLRKSIQDILVHGRHNQMEELVSDNSKLKLEHVSMESKMDLLKKQLEGGDKIKKEYQKRYEIAINDMNKLSDQFKHRIHELENKCTSINDEHSKLMEVLGSTRQEASEWKQKYEEMLNENGASNSQVGVDALPSKCSNSIDWKIRYENAVGEAKAVSEKIAVMEERLKQTLVKEDSMKAEFSYVLGGKEKVIAENGAKVVTLEEQLASLRSELLNKGELEEKYNLRHKEELEKLDLKLKNAESEVLGAKKLVDSSRIEAHAAWDNENKLQTLLEEKCIEIEQAKGRIEELEKVCLKLKEAEIEVVATKELMDSMKMEVEAARNNENNFQRLLQDKSIEADQAKARIEELEKVCLKLKDAETVNLLRIEVDAARDNENKLQTLLQEKCTEIEQAKGRIEELEKACLKLKDAETLNSMRIELEAARDNENKLQKLLQEKCTEIDQAKGRIEELEEVCLKLKDTETVNSMRIELEAARDNENKLQKLLEEKLIEIEQAEGHIKEFEKAFVNLKDTHRQEAAAMVKEFQNSIAMKMEDARDNENKLQTLLQEKCSEIDQAKGRIEELEKACLKLKDTETEAVMVKELMNSLKIEVEAARSNENKLQTLLEDKNIVINKAKSRIEDLEKLKMELSETLYSRTRQNEETVTELQKIIKENTVEEGSFQDSDEVILGIDTETPRVKRLKIETTTFSGFDLGEKSVMTPRKCTSKKEAAASSSSAGMEHSSFTVKRLRSEILNNGFGAELVGLKNPRKSVLVEIYERCVLRK